MKFLFRSDSGNSLAIARRVEAEGHAVRMWIANASMRHVGDGLVDKTQDISSVEWADAIVFDGHGHGLSQEAELWRAKKPVLGSSAFADKLEHDRLFGISVAEDAGFSVPDYRHFKGPKAWREARAFLEDQGDAEGGWVLKPNVDKVRTFLAVDTEEMLDMLEPYEDRFVAEKATPDFLLEWRLKGIETEVEGWFNGSEWFLPNGTIEEQRLYDGDLGTLTGCAGNVVWAYRSTSDPFVDFALSGLTETLKGKYRGPVAINFLVTSDGDPVFLEFSPRFGYSAIYAFLELIDDVGLMLYECAKGLPITVPVRKDVFAIGLRAVIPPYPGHEEDDTAAGYPVRGFDPKVMDRHLSPGDVRLVKNKVRTVGGDGIVMEVTQTGDTIPDARDALYRTAATLQVPNLGYRLDIGTTAKEDFDKLEGLGLVERPQNGEKEEFPWTSHSLR